MAAEAGIPSVNLREPATLSLFLRSIILPFRHPVSAVTASAIPGSALLVMTLLFPHTTVYADYGLLLGFDDPTFPLPATAGPRPSSLISKESWFLAWAIWLGSFALLAACFSIWQCAVVMRFTTPVGRLIQDSAERLPACLLACAIWFFVPALVTWSLITVAFRTLLAIGIIDPAASYLDPAQASAFAPWPLLVLFFLLRLPGLWLFARLSTIPPLVIARGWSTAVASGWVLSRRRGFLLSLCFAIVMMAGMPLVVLGYRGASSFLRDNVLPQVPYPVYDQTVQGLHWLLVIIARGTWGLEMIWIASLPALILRESQLQDSNDPATFD